MLFENILDGDPVNFEIATPTRPDTPEGTLGGKKTAKP